MKKIILLFCLYSFRIVAQETNIKYDVPIRAIGGKEDVEFIIATQMNYPAALLKKKAKEDVVVHFTVTKTGEIKNPHCKLAYPEEFKAEALRLVSFIHYLPATLSNVAVEAESSITIKFTPELYKKYCKTRGFIIPKDIANYDTSMIVYDKVDVFPEYIKGEEALGTYIANNLEYPELAVKQGLQGTVLLYFTVEKNGWLSNISVVKDFNHFCTIEAIKIMRNTKWIPAKKNGKYVRAKTQYPVIFSLRNINKDNSMSQQR